MESAGRYMSAWFERSRTHAPSSALDTTRAHARAAGPFGDPNDHEASVAPLPLWFKQLLTAKQMASSDSRPGTFDRPSSNSGSSFDSYLLAGALNRTTYRTRLTRGANYLLEKHRRHLRTLHGFGIVHGLQVGA